jgi:four helix bundle protein
VSVEANIVEGYALGSRIQFRRHLRIALGSAAETECLIDLAEEAGYLAAEIAAELHLKVDAALATLHGTLRSQGRDA